MKLFQNLFKPKWQNTDSAIRKQAIIALDIDESQSILKEIAINDDVLDIRLLALKRLTDIETINEASQTNTQTKVKDLGNKLMQQILSGQHESSLDDEQKILKIQQINNQALFEYIAENGNTISLRKAAIEHTSRESLLGNLAISDNDQNIRQISANKISQKSTLERVFKATKTKDKNISRIVKEKLDILITEAEKPAKLLAAQKTICSNLENLGSKGLWQRDKIQFDHELEQWAELKATNTLELQNRFDQAKQKFTVAYDRYLDRHKEELEQEAAYLPIKKEKQTIIDQLHQLITELENKTDLDENRLSNIQKTTHEYETSWKNLSSLPKAVEDEVRAQFDDAFHNIKNELKTRLHNKNLLSSLDKLQKDIQYHIKHPFKLSENIISKFEKSLNELNTHSLDQETEKLQQDIKNKLSQASTLVDKQQKRMDGLFDEVKSKLDEMEKHLNDGALKEALNIRKTVQSHISEMEKFRVKSVHQLKNRLNSTAGKINELSNWRSWANTPKKQQLIDKVDALIDNDIDPKEIAFIISQAKNDWKKLGPSEKDSSQELWEQFQTTCNKAYEPCKTFFAEESITHKENYAKRIEFLETLETFLQQADWEDTDWKKVETLFRHARQEWQNIGLTDKRKRKPLNDRFYTAFNQLKTALNSEWDKNEKVKATIVTEAQALTEIEDLNEAMNAAKTLQQRWKTAGRIQHIKERKLWADFKQASDAVFSRRDDLNKQKVEDANKLVDEKNAIVKKIEAHCNQSLEDISKTKPVLKQLQAELKAHDVTRPETRAGFEKRVTEALNIYERKLESLEKHDIVLDLIRLKQKSDVCLLLEQSLEHKKTIDVESFNEQLNNIQSPKQGDWDKRINRRFQALIQLSQQDNVDESLTQAATKNLETQNRNAVVLEIIAGIETPLEAAADRLKAQTQRLSDKLQNHAEENQWDSFLNAEVNWLTTGPISSKEMISLSQRHTATINALKTEYPEELKNY